mmetsp:Transcript_30489/g.65518  ORF Transcript_30489/g.65518 Transcript_30489/m.65518 type:complete len:201 (-) Transcript_30489:169-771(-)
MCSRFAHCGFSELDKWTWQSAEHHWQLVNPIFISVPSELPAHLHRLPAKRANMLHTTWLAKSAEALSPSALYNGLPFQLRLDVMKPDHAKTSGLGCVRLPSVYGLHVIGDFCLLTIARSGLCALESSMCYVFRNLAQFQQALTATPSVFCCCDSRLLQLRYQSHMLHVIQRRALHVHADRLTRIGRRQSELECKRGSRQP